MSRGNRKESFTWYAVLSSGTCSCTVFFFKFHFICTLWKVISRVHLVSVSLIFCEFKVLWNSQSRIFRTFCVSRGVLLSMLVNCRTWKIYAKIKYSRNEVVYSIAFCLSFVTIGKSCYPATHFQLSKHL